MEEFRIKLDGDKYDLKRFLITATIKAPKYVWKSQSILEISDEKGRLGIIFMDRNYPNVGTLQGLKLFKFLYPTKELKTVINHALNM